MPLRKCAGCGGDLAAGSTARAKYCSPTCRQRGHRSGGAALALVSPAAPSTPPADGDTQGDDDGKPASFDRVAALERATVRLEKLLGESDPRSAAALNKEYRETMRELDALRAETQEVGSRARRDTAGRAFDASAI